MGSKALPTHLRAPESEAFGGKHHGKTQSHMVSFTSGGESLDPRILKLRSCHFWSFLLFWDCFVGYWTRRTKENSFLCFLLFSSPSRCCSP